MSLQEQLKHGFKELIEGNDTTTMLNAFMVSTFYDRENLKTNSRVKMGQISPLTKLFAFGKMFDIDLPLLLGNTILELQISAYGLGRKEIIALYNTINQNYQLDQEPTIDKTNIFK